MQKKGLPMEVKVGALVLFSLTLLVMFILVLGDFTVGDGFEFQVEFENAGGLKPGADVAIAGLNVGSVRELRFIETKKSADQMNAVAVSARLYIDPKYKDAIRQDSGFFITTRGVLGEPYIEIVTESYAKPAIAAGATMRGVDPPRMDIIFSKGARLLEVLTDLLESPDIAAKDLLKNGAKLIGTVNDILESNRKDIDGTISGVHVAVDEAGTLLKSANVAVEDGEELKALFADLRGSARDLRSASRSARSIASSVDRDIDPLLKDASTLATEAREVASSAKRIIADNEPRITRTISEVETATQNLNALSKDARKMVADIKSGKGTVGQILADREMYDDMREVLRQIKQQPWKIIWKE